MHYFYVIDKKYVKQNVLCRIFKNVLLWPKIGYQTALNINLTSTAFTVKLWNFLLMVVNASAGLSETCACQQRLTSAALLSRANCKQIQICCWTVNWVIFSQKHTTKLSLTLADVEFLFWKKKNIFTSWRH